MVFEVLVGLVLCEIDEVFVVVDFVFLNDVDDDEMVVFKDLGLDWFFFFFIFYNVVDLVYKLLFDFIDMIRRYFDFIYLFFKLLKI